MNPDRRPYWDMGPAEIKSFLNHHLKVCHENDICNKLRLQDLEVEHTANPELVRPRSPSKSPEQRKKARTERQPLRHGTSDSLFTVEDFLRLNVVTRVSGGGVDD